VGFSTFNPELIPSQLLIKMALAIGATPFSLMLETLVIHFLYEIVREAGLRIPHNLGHAISVVGGLVVGNAAVEAGLIGAPTIMIVALTVISSFVVPNLYEPIAILRLFFIIAGGTLGIWGIMIFFSAVLVNLCSKSNFGIPFTAPISPFSLFGMRDTVLRTSWKTLSKNRNRIQKMPGTGVSN
ncbi:MAG: spore germination protein, partial [Firmicutes bacterium]|nr:spore germination protein [Bacillota bacterium]